MLQTTLLLLLCVLEAGQQQSPPSHKHPRPAAPVCAAGVSTARLICTQRAGWQRCHYMTVSDCLRLPVLQGTTMQCWCAPMAS